MCGIRTAFEPLSDRTRMDVEALLEATDLETLKELFYMRDGKVYDNAYHDATVNRVNHAIGFAIVVKDMELARKLMNMLVSVGINTRALVSYVRALEANEEELAAVLRPQEMSAAGLSYVRSEEVFERLCREYDIPAEEIRRVRLLYRLIRMNATGATRAAVNYAYRGDREEGRRALKYALTAEMRETVTEMFGIEDDSMDEEEDA